MQIVCSAQNTILKPDYTFIIELLKLACMVWGIKKLLLVS